MLSCIKPRSKCTKKVSYLSVYIYLQYVLHDFSILWINQKINYVGTNRFFWNNLSYSHGWPTLFDIYDKNVVQNFELFTTAGRLLEKTHWLEFTDINFSCKSGCKYKVRKNFELSNFLLLWINIIINFKIESRSAIPAAAESRFPQEISNFSEPNSQYRPVFRTLYYVCTAVRPYPSAGPLAAAAGTRCIDGLTREF